jgi:RNA-directed DNA polymerase
MRWLPAVGTLTCRKDGVRFTSFLPAISKGALKKISAEIRSWRLYRWVNSDGREIAKLINPKVRRDRAE